VTKVLLSPAARDDLYRIDDYTLERFGLRQARRALGIIEEAFQMLAAFPASAPHRPEFDPPGRRFRYRSVLRSLLIVYEVSQDSIRVARILDARQGDLRGLLQDETGGAADA